MAETQRSRDLARAALLRERIIGALKAAPAPMSVGELCGMSGIVELYHARLLPQKVEAQVRALAKTGQAAKVRDGVRARWYAGKPGAAQAAPPSARPAAEQPSGMVPVAFQHLALEVHKADRRVAFIFEGLQISIKVLP